MNKCYDLHIDSNSINAKGGMPAMNQIYKWAKDDRVCITYDDAGMEEQPDGNIQWQELNKHFSQNRTRENPQYKANFEIIRDILFPEFKGVFKPAMAIGKILNKAQRKAFMDILHLCGYKQGMGDYFLTNDTHFLNKKAKLEHAGIRNVITPEDCVKALSLDKALTV